MNIRRITAFAAAFVLSAGIVAYADCGVDPSGSNFTVSAAEDADDDFVVKTDKSGKKYVESYKGEGGDIRIPDGVEYIGGYAFEFNSTVTGVTFPESCVKTGQGAFTFCSALKSVVFEGDAEIGAMAFSDSYALESVAVKGSIIEEIGDNAFDRCASLKTVKISGNENKFTIGNSAFRNCYRLKSVKIPSKCTKIGMQAFENCFSLRSLTVPAKTKMDFRCAGYAYIALEEDDYNSAREFVADGKKSGYVFDHKTEKYDMKVTPKPITLNVRKGSPAEKYAKENGIKYRYPKTSKSKSK